MGNHKNTNENIRLKIREIKGIKHLDACRAKKMEDELIISLAYLVHSVVFKYKRFNNYEDLYQEGMLGLIKAVRRYNSDTSFHFVRYALWWIKTRVMRSIKKINLVTIPGNHIKYFMQYNVQEHDMIDYDNPETKTILAEKIDMINFSITTMPERHQQVINMRYGLNNTQQYNLQDLSNKLDVSCENLRQLEQHIINKLRENSAFNE